MGVGSLVKARTRKGFVFSKLAIALIVSAFIWSSSTAQAKYASIVIEAETGRILNEVNADELNHPASLTKMMTLYLTFEALKAGKINLDTPFAVSQHAASRAPSKLNLVAGQTITVRNLVLAVITKSANDAASVLAEGIGGTEPAFAQRMTEKARQLGMSRTVYRNASGLPDPQQVTSARDLSKLAIALLRDFPDRYRLFATEEFSYNGQTFSNHNHLMRSFEGMDGIKTGFTNASGFNLAASAVRDNRRLVGVVMGGQSARARDIQMARLLNDSFANRASPSPVLVAEDQSGGGLAHRAARGAKRVVAALSPISRAEAATPSTSRAALHAPHQAKPVEASWSIQVGAFSHRGAAEKAASVALPKVPAKGKSVQVLNPAHSDKEKLYRARIINLTEKEADAACRALRKKHGTCAIMAPGVIKTASR